MKYYLTQLDTHGRRVLTIVSQNRFYKLLENDEVGSIVSKMWMGSKKSHNMIEASTLYRSLQAPVNSDESMFYTR